MEVGRDRGGAVDGPALRVDVGIHVGVATLHVVVGQAIGRRGGKGEGGKAGKQATAVDHHPLLIAGGARAAEVRTNRTLG